MEARPVAYPSFRYSDYLPSTDDYDVTRQIMAETETMFRYLGYECGDLLPSARPDGRTIMAKTKQWSDYAARCGHSIPPAGLLNGDVLKACENRAAVWAALRHWAMSPSEERRNDFMRAVTRVPPPPGSRMRRLLRLR
jgi:hypothetical protein